MPLTDEQLKTLCLSGGIRFHQFDPISRERIADLAAKEKWRAEMRMVTNATTEQLDAIEQAANDEKYPLSYCRDMAMEGAAASDIPSKLRDPEFMKRWVWRRFIF